MPRSSRFKQAVGGERARWSESDHLLAGIYDSLVRLDWRYGRVHFKGRAQPPEPLRRPGDADPNRRLGGQRSFTREALDAVLARMRPKKGVTDGD